MRLPAAVAAEWALVRRRLLRTRLGLWLLILTSGAALLAVQAPPSALAGQLARLGMLAGLLGVAFTGASEADRAALPLFLTHPTTPLRLLGGRAVAVLVPAAAALALALSIAVPARAPGAGVAAAAFAGGLGAAAAAVGAALAAASLGGTGLVGALLAYVAIASPLPPEAWRGLAVSPLLRGGAAALLEWLPGLWRYRRLAGGDLLAWGHALAWALGGVAFAAWRLERRMR